MMKTIERAIENWSVHRESDRYKAPECLENVLYGIVDGEKITTSAIVASQGTKVQTASGSVYRLGTIDPNYLAWMKVHKLEYDKNDPIKEVDEFTGCNGDPTADWISVN